MPEKRQLCFYKNKKINSKKNSNDFNEFTVFLCSQQRGIVDRWRCVKVGLFYHSRTYQSMELAGGTNATINIFTVGASLKT